MTEDKIPQNVIDEFARISPIAWMHLLFTGRYNFSKTNGDIDIREMAEMIEKHLKEVMKDNN